ncbi:hypothetical protein IJT17_06865, partial [bacterium]|nr:hypothetical protein [bacterium]
MTQEEYNETVKPSNQYVPDIPDDMTQEKYNEIVRDRWDGEYGASETIGYVTDEEIIHWLLDAGLVSDEGIQMLIDTGIIDEWPVPQQ